MTHSIRRRHLLPLTALLLAFSLTACKKEAPPPPAPDTAPAPAAAPAPVAAPAAPAVSVATVMLGNAIGPDNKVTKDSITFGKKDTIYASVITTGAATPTTKLTARWSFEGKAGSKPVSEESRSNLPTGEANATEFHVSKPSGWPAGDYKVEILLDDKSVATKAFRVG